MKKKFSFWKKLEEISFMKHRKDEKTVLSIERTSKFFATFLTLCMSISIIKHVMQPVQWTVSELFRLTWHVRKRRYFLQPVWKIAQKIREPTPYRDWKSLLNGTNHNWTLYWLKFLNREYHKVIKRLKINIISMKMEAVERFAKNCVTLISSDSHQLRFIEIRAIIYICLRNYW